MHQKLAVNYQKMIDLTDQILGDLSEVEDEVLYQKIEQKKWSIIQILNHLILAERMSLRYIQKKFPAIDQLYDAGLKATAAMKAMKIAQRSSRKFKAPDQVSQPEGDTSLSDIKTNWKVVQDELKSFLDNYPDKYLKKALFKHPFIGRVSLNQMMEINIEHMRRHQLQIEQLLKKYNC
jgi:uncharacterized damage-inducible protein DinB